MMSRYRFINSYYNGNNRGVINYMEPEEVELLDSSVADMLSNASSPDRATMAEFICESWNHSRSQIFHLVRTEDLGMFTHSEVFDFESGVGITWGDGERDTDVGHESNASLRLDVTAEDVGEGRTTKSRIYNVENVTPGDYIRIEAFVRGTGFVAEDDAVCIGVDSWKNGGVMTAQQSHMFCSENLLGSDWSHFSGVLRVPDDFADGNNNMYLQTQIIAINPGEVWFDDITLSRTEDPGVTPLDCTATTSSCDSTHLGYCNSQSACEAVEGIWCNGLCDDHSCDNLD
jgi:hypothetical protein